MAGKYRCWDIWVYFLYSNTNSLCDHGQTMQPKTLSKFNLSLKHTPIQPLLRLRTVELILFVSWSQLSI